MHYWLSVSEIIHRTQAIRLPGKRRMTARDTYH